MVARGADKAVMDKEGNSAVHTAATYGHLEVLGLLHEAQLEIDTANTAGQTPLHLAARMGHHVRGRNNVECGIVCGDGFFLSANFILFAPGWGIEKGGGDLLLVCLFVSRSEK